MIVKYGGNAMKSLELRRAVAREVAALRVGAALDGLGPLTVVHGGGPAINRELELRGIESHFVRGVRVTSPEAMQVAEMTLTLLGKELAQDLGGALGLTGRDDALLLAELQDPALGRVGRVTQVNIKLLRAVQAAGYTPVVGCVAVDAAGESLNVNADLAAGAVAGALGEGVVFLTDVDGVYRQYPDPASLCARLSVAEVGAGIEAGWIEGGMIPKVEAALAALAAGAPFATIASGMRPGVLALALRGESGTRFTP